MSNQITFTKKEEQFIKRAIQTTAPDLKDSKLNPTIKADLLVIINTYRARGYMVGRRIDGGKEAGLWRSIRAKLGKPIKSREEILRENAEKHVKGVITRATEIHDSKIADLEMKLKLAKEAKLKAQNEVEALINAELADIEAKKKDALKRLAEVENVKKKLQIDKEIKEIESKREEILEEKDGQRKCWTCGEWFSVAGGAFTKHIKSCKKN